MYMKEIIKKGEIEPLPILVFLCLACNTSWKTDVYKIKTLEHWLLQSTTASDTCPLCESLSFNHE